MRFIGVYTLNKTTKLKSTDAPKTHLNEDLVDYFITKDGQTFAGFHLLVEIWGSQNLTDPAGVDEILRSAARAANATVLHSHIHQFLPSGGVSGVVLLAESHLSIHTWPERNYAAIDIFMCGECDPYLAVKVLKQRFNPSDIQVQEIRRGILQNYT